MTRHAPLDLYLDAIAQIHDQRAGTQETSYYPAVERVLNAVGEKLKPAVFCLHHPSGESGIPDFGLFEQLKFQRGRPPEWSAGVVPDRGVVEVKGASHSMAALLGGKQVKEKYLPRYGLLLATNLRQFRLVAAEGELEAFDLAGDEAAFWKLVHGSRPDPLRTRFADFLQRCLLTRAPLARPADVAFFLASYARDALARLAERAELPALAALRKGMEEALGLSFDAKDGEHLFRSTLVQTLFYGLFSAWIVDARAGKGTPFNWRGAEWSMTVPVVGFLFRQIATPEALGPLQIVPLLDAAARSLDRVVREAFFTSFDDAQAVQYFYEPFLEFFDPELRRQLGVWYTPPEIVEYMVERVDRVLRSELGLADGLADPNVWVLDPCCGTGSFVVAVLKRIRQTLDGKGLGALAAEEVKKAATTRIVGFEILTAPFTVAHWQVGQQLRDSPLAAGERAAVYLTNALTGWMAGDAGPPIPGFEPLVEERGAAGAVKRQQPILVVLGNPPYNAFAGTSPESEGGLMEVYKQGLQSEWGIKKFNLDDLYVRFFRIAERRIAEGTGRGVICYISNYSWLTGGSYTVMRRSLVRNFDRTWVENMHGDRKITEYGPDGRSSETVFAMKGSSPGIRQGVATALLVRTGRSETPHYLFRNDIDASAAAERRGQLLASLDDLDLDAHYCALNPNAENRFLLWPGSTAADYASWPTLPELAREAPLNGLMEKRGGALIDSDRDALERRMRLYFDYPAQSMEAVRCVAPGLAEDRARFSAQSTRKTASEREGFLQANLLRYWLRPFETCWAYVTQVRPVWNEPRPQLVHVLPDAGGFLASRVRGIADPEGHPTTWTPLLADDHALRADAFVFPVIENLSGAPRPNISAATAAWLASLDLPADAESARLVWHHALAVTYSPAWLTKNADGIRQGWPRVPLPGSADLLRESAALGAQVTALLDPDAPVPGVTTGAVRPELAAIAVPTVLRGEAADWRLTAGWGHRTEKGAVMPGRGRLDTRPYAADAAEAAKHAGLLGNATHDVWLNATTFWRNVPDAVWEFHIGGYQVLKKWLSYREQNVLGRAMTPAEVTHVMHTARRLAALRLLGPQLDASFRACAAAHRPLERPASVATG